MHPKNRYPTARVMRPYLLRKQLVKVSVEVPTNLSKKQKDALQAFESTLEDKNYSRRASFFDKLKDLFK